MRPNLSAVIVMISLLVVGDIAAADDLELRRPYEAADPVSFGFDNEPNAGGCTDYECGSICYNGHGGSDFPLPYGTDVLAGADGTVTATNNSCDDYGYLGNTCGGRCGNYVQLQHSNGDYTIYCHMRQNSLVVSTGDTVSCGDVLGESASSGSSTGPHLHLGWRPGGGNSTDVYAGSCNNSPGAWVEQNAYDEPVSADCACEPTTEVCDGNDNNCDGTVDSGDVCEIELLHQAPHSYTRPTTTDVDDSGVQHICGRFYSGFRCFKPTGDGWEESIGSDLMAQPDGWDQPEYYSTIRMGDVTGNDRADLCARGPDGLTCYESTGDEFIPFDTIGWSDDSSWDSPQFYTTIRLADLNGNDREDVCARGIAGWRCYLSEDDGFGERIDTDLFTDDDGFHRARYYGTIRTGDITGDGSDEVCARGPDGFSCYSFDGDGFEHVATSTGKADEHGWDNIIYWPSIRLADIDGDGSHALCARDSSSLFCRRFDGDDFGSKIELGGLSNDSGWSDPTNYATLRAGDVTGDGSDDLCIRANAGMRCYRVDDDDVTRWDGPEWSNANGWEDTAVHGPTFITSIDEQEPGALCGRSPDGLSCHTYTDGDFEAYEHFDQFTDAGSWDAPEHAHSLQMGAGPCRADWCDEPIDDPDDPDDPIDEAEPDDPDADVGVPGDVGSSGDGQDYQADEGPRVNTGCNAAGGTSSGLIWLVALLLVAGLVWRRRTGSVFTAALLVTATFALIGCDRSPDADQSATDETAEAVTPEQTDSPSAAGGTDASAETEHIVDNDHELLAIHGSWRVTGDPDELPEGTDGPPRYEPQLLHDDRVIDWPSDLPPVSDALIVGDEPTLFALGLDDSLYAAALSPDTTELDPRLIDRSLTSQLSPATGGCCIAYIQHGDEGQRLRIYDIDDDAFTDYRLGHSIGWAPTVADDGQRIAWTASPYGHASILIDEPTGDEPRPIVNTDTDLGPDELDPFPGGIHAPVWTPDGIAFEAADSTLWLIDADGNIDKTADGEQGMFWDEPRQKLVDRLGEPIDWQQR